ncbi:MAG: neutral/alkaline non-lysosomal ceramidase N-terminal domain-containing protein [Firmicutes bacterium]|nr:neutral/alkaline non-lysosomal ceramidase N-terminal domain-containing protein [Bacillota bacterium]
MKQRLLAGTGAHCITPPLGLPMAGFAARQGGSIGVHDDLWAKALVLDCNDVAVALVSLDLIDVTLELTESIRNIIAKNTGLPRDHILIATSHTHSGPELETAYRFAPGPAEYGEWIPTFVHLVAESVQEAWVSRTPALLGTGVTTVQGIGVNRRGKDVVDNEVGLVKVERPDGSVLAVIFNYACHAVVLGPDNRLITADYPGYAQRSIEKALNGKALALFMNGAAGDINTGHSADVSAIGGFIPGRTFERAQELGERLAQAVVVALPEIKTNDVIDLDVLVIPWEPKYRCDLPAPEKLQHIISGLEERIKQSKNEKEIFQLKLDLVYHQIMLRNALEIWGSITKTKHTEIQGIRLHDAAIITLPGEVFVEIGLKIKQYSPFSLTLIAGYTNDAIGYIPTHEALITGGYESISTKFAAGTDEELINKTVECLIQLYQRK